MSMTSMNSMNLMFIYSIYMGHVLINDNFVKKYLSVSGDFETTEVF